MKHKKPVNHSVPEVIPKYGGNITFPAPKNIANNAKPVTTTSLIFTCIIKSFLLMYYDYSHIFILYRQNKIYTIQKM